MSWVLILMGNEHQRPPAVIGGYPSQADAEQAGELAIFCNEDKCVIPTFTRYSVIPGAACSGPLGAVHVTTSHEAIHKPTGWALNVTRCAHRWP